MLVFWRLFLALLVTDFIFQAEKFTGLKMRRATAEFIHLSVFFILACAFNYRYLDAVWFSVGPVSLSGIPSLILFSAAHYALDALFETPEDFSSVLPRTAKVIWHKIMLFWALLIISPDVGLSEGRNLFPEPVLIAFCGLFLVTGYTSSVICSYEEDACIIKKQSRDEIYFTALHRAVMYGLCLMPGFSWILFCAIWFVLSWYAATRRFFDISNFNLYYGGAFALICGALVRLIIYA